MSVTHLLSLIHYEVDRQPHIVVDAGRCRSCPHRACLTTCPAECYLANEKQEVEFSYEACLECGTCRVLCDQDAIVWDHPRGGFGVGFRLA
jgi:ferredoxin like protein